MKNLLIGITSGVLIGAGAILGISQIPSVGNAIIKGNNSSSSIENVEKDNQISNLEISNTKLKQDIENLNNQLSEANSEIELKNAQIVEKENQIETLSKEKASLQSDLDMYKELAGNDVNYIDLLASVQSQLDEKTSLLNSATAELEQLRIDKTSLETRVSELETELEATKQELANYKTLGDIDKLNISHYDGTWYLNGTFEDYYTIENGVVTHNANQDKGLLNTIYNQMYLMMNTAGGTEVTLSDDGTSFVTADNKTYSKFYINTENTVTPNYLYCGTYSNGTTQIKLNPDNTTTMTDGENTYTGAYLVTTKEKNIGGNITRYNTITATYQTDSGPIVKVFNNTSRNNLLDDGDTVYSQTEYMSGAILSSKSTEPYAVPTDYYCKIIVKTDSLVTINPGESVSIRFSYGNERKDSSYGNNASLVINDVKVGTKSTYYLANFYNASEEKISTNLFEFYSISCSWGYYAIKDVVEIGDISADIVSVEKGTYSGVGELFGEFYRIYKNSLVSEVNTIPCQAIFDYTNGTYSDDTNTILLSEDTATVNNITATTYGVTATTDGTDIYQTVTLTYITTDEEEAETTHTVVLTFKNKQLQTTKLDDEDLTLSRN